MTQLSRFNQFRTILALKVINEQFAHRFTEIKPVWLVLTTSTLLKIYNLSDLIMPRPVWLMTVQEAYREYNTLIDQIWTKYKLLDSGKCGKVGTPGFNAECSELSHVMAQMSELYSHLNLPMPKEPLKWS